MHGIFVILCLCSPLFARQLPDHFVVKWKKPSAQEMPFYLGPESGAPKVLVHRKPEGRQVKFTFLTPSYQKLAVAKTLYFPTISHTDLYSSEENFLGRIQHKRHSMLPAEYEVFDAGNHLIALGEMNWLGTRLTLLDPNDTRTELISYTRPYFRIAVREDFWHVEVHKRGSVPDPLIWMVGVFQTDLVLN